MPRAYSIIFWFSAMITLTALVLLVIFGLNLSVDFTGGTLVEIDFSNGRPDLNNFRQIVDGEFTNADLAITEAGDSSLVIKTKQLSDTEHSFLLEIVKTKFGDAGPSEVRFDSVGPIIGDELKNKSITAIVLVLAGITIYIAYVFRKMRSVLSPWTMGLAAIASVIHDVAIPLGIFAVLGHYSGVEVTAIFVAAVLTILGYSVSDTVVIFDRIRENLLRYGNKESFGLLIHRSVMQTLTRSFNTSLTTVLSLIAIYLFGGETLKYFSLALIIGILLGSYSSIFVASPLLWYWSRKN